MALSCPRNRNKLEGRGFSCYTAPQTCENIHSLPKLLFHGGGGGRGSRATLKAFLTRPFFSLSAPLSLSEPVSGPHLTPSHPEHLHQDYTLNLEPGFSSMCPTLPKMHSRPIALQALLSSLVCGSGYILMPPFPARP